MATAEGGTVDKGVCAMPDSGLQSKKGNALLQRRKPAIVLEKLSITGVGEQMKSKGDIVPDSQDTVLMISDDENMVSVKGSDPRIVSDVRLPRDYAWLMRIL
ncbi:PREDICTED: uncharacterized protein LOC105148595 isoform X1 [Acromyrmex echinatior]|uniref:uncharacterized protein LOC105148595 isoform X1 n=1 Tax=Acromyrmex echinatior TaxID=103372 RepID=UPI000580FAE5|nr:PREDICTED: uncharacterized protein LOC105148595 isoform X1 [Acromyrmex echinatior]